MSLFAEADLSIQADLHSIKSLRQHQRDRVFPKGRILGPSPVRKIAHQEIGTKSDSDAAKTQKHVCRGKAPRILCGITKVSSPSKDSVAWDAFLTHRRNQLHGENTKLTVTFAEIPSRGLLLIPKYNISEPFYPKSQRRFRAPAHFCTQEIKSRRSGAAPSWRSFCDLAPCYADR